MVVECFDDQFLSDKRFTGQLRCRTVASGNTRSYSVSWTMSFPRSWEHDFRQSIDHDRPICRFSSPSTPSDNVSHRLLTFCIPHWLSFEGLSLYTQSYSVINTGITLIPLSRSICPSLPFPLFGKFRQWCTGWTISVNILHSSYLVEYLCMDATQAP